VMKRKSGVPSSKVPLPCLLVRAQWAWISERQWRLPSLAVSVVAGEMTAAVVPAASAVVAVGFAAGG